MKSYLHRLLSEVSIPLSAIISMLPIVEHCKAVALCRRTSRLNRQNGFTLVELMIVLTIVAVLAAVAIPLMHGRIDSAKWSEGNAAAGTIRTAVSTYVFETSVANAQAVLIGRTLAEAQVQTNLGFGPFDLSGTYFVPGDYTITNITATGVAVVTVTSSKPDAPVGTMVLDANGIWH